VVNFEQQFERRVVEYFVDEYGRGRTPNPCLPCNEHIKFGALMARAEALDADYLATGHYARIETEDGGFRLLAGVDPEKDQSYVLYALGQRQLARLRFPLGSRTKSDVRSLAAAFNLPNAGKPDSADICFLPTEDYREFISQRVPQLDGDIIDGSGVVVGHHSGVSGFTIGQRRGLGVAIGERRYVTSIDPELNVVTIGSEEDLLCDSLIAESMRWVAGGPPADEFEAGIRVRYRAAVERARVRVEGGRVHVLFELPVRAVSAGQAAVCYRNDEVLGGGIIASASSLTGGGSTTYR
jgi:tRNA-specific 2-thiouridylase